MNNGVWATRVNDIKSASDVIFQGLIEMIYEGKLEPGQKLIQEEIASIFDVSRVPVRDALQKLTEVGLAERVPRKGLIVAKFYQKRILELYETRKILETAAIALVVKNITSDDIDRLKQIVEEQKKAYLSGDIKKAVLEDDKFHQLLFSSFILKNDILAYTINSIRLRIKHVRDVSRFLTNDSEWILKSTNRHLGIIQSIKSRNIPNARRQIDSILSSAKEEAINFIRNYKQ